MQFKRKKHHIAAGIGLLILIGFAITNAVGQVTTQETGSSAINISTDSVTNIKETEATFQATLTGFDDTDYDAALIYWNYSTDSSLDQPGAVTVENTEKQRSVLNPGIDPDTSYNVEAYAEPIVWDDSTLMDNYAETLSRSSFTGEYPAEFKPDLSQTYSHYSNTSEASITINNDMAISRDGKKLVTVYSYSSYIGGYYNDAYVYNLSTPWDLKTAEQSSTTSLNANNQRSGIHVSPDGSYMATSGPGNSVIAYELSTPWDMSTASQTGNMTLGDFNPTGDGVFFRPGGSQMFLSEGNGEVRSYNLAESWNLSTASETNTINVANADGIAFSDGGTKMLVSDGGSGGINSYDLSSPWDISSYSSASSLSTSNDANGVAVSPNGDRIFYNNYNDVYGLER